MLQKIDDLAADFNWRSNGCHDIHPLKSCVERRDRETQACRLFYSKGSIWLDRHFTVTSGMEFLRCRYTRLLVLNEVGNIPEIMGQGWRVDSMRARS